MDFHNHIVGVISSPQICSGQKYISVKFNFSEDGYLALLS